MNLKLTALTLTCVSLFSLQPALAVDTDQCASCHGKDGNSTDPLVPSIAGMSSPYLADNLDAYATGSRVSVKYTPTGGNETDMNEIAAKLSADEIGELADHYAGLSFSVQQQSVDSALAAEGKKHFEKYCDKCHTDAGTLAEDDASLLLGQWKPYLQSQITVIQSGNREVPKKMAKQLKKLGDSKVQAVIEYLASGQL